MSLLNAFFIYLLIWWTMLFAVLPLGVERNTDVHLGHDPGAPKDPRLKQKLLLNTALSAVVLAVIWLLVETGVVTWGEWFRGAIK
jgi:predicted secreted protein